MKTANYSELEYAISHQDTYNHGSSNGIWEHNSEGDDIYQVWSYRTLMLVIKNDEITYFNSDKYSMTTSRLQNIIRRNYNVSALEQAYSQDKA